MTGKHLPPIDTRKYRVNEAGTRAHVVDTVATRVKLTPGECEYLAWLRSRDEGKAA